MEKIMMDRRMKSKIESLHEHDNGSCSVKFTDLHDTFWFEDKEQLQDFVNQVARERYYDKELRRGYFTYTNEHNEIFKYHVKSNRGTLTLIKEECA